MYIYIHTYRIGEESPTAKAGVTLGRVAYRGLVDETMTLARRHLLLQEALIKEIPYKEEKEKPEKVNKEQKEKEKEREKATAVEQRPHSMIYIRSRCISRYATR